MVTNVSQCVDHFLEGEPILTPAYNLQLVTQFDGEVTLAEVNQSVGNIITDKNHVFRCLYERNPNVACG